MLLKNEGSLLPLDKHKLGSIAVIGAEAADPTVGGGGSGSYLPYYKSTPLAAIRQRFTGLVPAPPPPSSCPGKLLHATDLANTDDVTVRPAAQVCGLIVPQERIAQQRRGVDCSPFRRRPSAAPVLTAITRTTLPSPSAVRCVGAGEIREAALGSARRFRTWGCGTTAMM